MRVAACELLAAIVEEYELVDEIFRSVNKVADLWFVCWHTLIAHTLLAVPACGLQVGVDDRHRVSSRQWGSALAPRMAISLPRDRTLASLLCRRHVSVVVIVVVIVVVVLILLTPPPIAPVDNNTD
jgi:hypothetical protein